MLPDGPEYKRIRRLLQPPATKPSLRVDRNRAAEYGWLRQHAKEFTGKWVAVSGDELVAVADSFKQLRKKLAETPHEQTPLLHYLE